MRGALVSRRVRWVAAALVLVAVSIQFVPVDRTNPAVPSPIDAPADVERILRRSCFDCHSHETRWPWYSRVAPMSWFVADHVHEGRRDLNFSRWPVFDFEEQNEAFRDIGKMIRAGKMPLRSYLWLHPDARLSEADKAKLLEWATPAAPPGEMDDD